MGTGASCASELDVIEEDGAASTGCNASVKLDAALSTSGSLGNGAASTASSPITNYEVLRKIGRGSYGTVFLVRDQRDGLY
jgi:serine/threonine protein kinase